jgi:hypothetical protein
MNHLTFNPWAIVVCAVIQWVLGAIWYSPVLFAKPWKAMVYAHSDPKKNNMVAGMIVSFLGSLILSFVLAHVVLWASVTTPAHGALVGFIMWAGFIVAPLSAQHIYEGRPFNLFAINVGYWLVGLAISGAVIAVWR